MIGSMHLIAVVGACIARLPLAASTKAFKLACQLKRFWRGPAGEFEINTRITGADKISRTKYYLGKGVHIFVQQLTLSTPL
jgi:hypothetical protein